MKKSVGIYAREVINYHGGLFGDFNLFQSVKVYYWKAK